MRSFTFTNGYSQTVTIQAGHGAYILSRFDTGLLEGRAQTVITPEQDGQATYDIRRGARSVNLEGYIMAETQREMDERKARFYAAFDVKYMGELVYTNATGRYHLPCRALALPSLLADGGGGLLYKFAVTLQSDASYFTVYPAQTVAAGVTYLNHRFPWFLPSTGTPFALDYRDSIAHNPSDLNIYPTIEVMDTQGATVHIVNDTTGAFLHILRPVGVNQKMVVDTERSTAVLYTRDGDAWVRGESVLRWLSMASRIRDFYLVPGVNIINVNEDEPTGKPIALVKYAVPAMGV